MSICKLLDLSKFPDCYALSENGRCTRLTIYDCQGEKCTFKRTGKEEIDSIQSAYQRLSNLDNSTQKHIAKKYYGDHMPWKEEQPVELSRGYRRLRNRKRTMFD